MNRIKCPKCGEVLDLPNSMADKFLAENKEFFSQVLSRSAQELDGLSNEAKAELQKMIDLIHRMDKY